MHLHQHLCPKYQNDTYSGLQFVTYGYLEPNLFIYFPLDLFLFFSLHCSLVGETTKLESLLIGGKKQNQGVLDKDQTE